MVEVDGRMIEVGVGRQPLGRRRAIHAEDQARIGGLMLHRGAWQGGACCRRLDRRVARPCALNPNYGCCGGSTPGAAYRNASEHSYFASGAGGNITWVDPENDLTAVMRWIDPAAVDGFIGRVIRALERG